ncbi:DUF4142 domain-containing protein [Ramlibacter sp.]|uniref:DUF4142 domain-containing protein n=1 Tax=Ramlibacter sp. TaxID=1917967 RepID=UPI002C467D4C|nr:DUF4142 domain-containing protein [Ramlibacter sp.]HWI81822.1 DUF4142 domain-containing protein [Ramlibacter sp.]
MKRVGWCLGAAAAALLWAVAARAETEAEYGRPVPAAPRGAGGPGSPPAKARPMFAPGAVAGARRLEPHEREERRFLRDASAASRFQAEAARLALARSGDPHVRSLATNLMAHHGAAADELLRLLHQRGMAAPMLENTQRRALSRLGRLQGAKFDREFLEAVAVGAQQDEVEVFEKAGGAVQDPALGAWIARTLPALRYQLAEAQRLSAGTRRRAAAARRAPPGSAAAGRGQRVE